MELSKQNVDYGDIRKIWLECKDPSRNTFKYYILTRNKDKPNQFLAEWGRIGSKPQSMEYHYSKKTMWEQYQAKINKGYSLITSQTFDQAGEADANEPFEYLKSIGIDVDSLDDLWL
jgi:predicted DNA-binding WGR domain protein